MSYVFVAASLRKAARGAGQAAGAGGAGGAGRAVPAAGRAVAAAAAAPAPRAAPRAPRAPRTTHQRRDRPRHGEDRLAGPGLSAHGLSQPRSPRSTAARPTCAWRSTAASLLRF